MFRVFLSGHLKEFSSGRTEVALGGEHQIVSDVLAELWREEAGLRDRILNEQGEVRQHVNIFYDGRDVRRINGLETKIENVRELYIFNAVSGG